MGEGEGTPFFTRNPCWKSEGACATCQHCSQTPRGWSAASCWTPWSSCSTVQPQLGCQLGNHAVFILRGHSWPGISTDLAVPDSCEGTKQGWRAEAFVTSVESLEVQRGLSLCLGCGQCWRSVCFHGSVFPQQPSSLQEHRRSCACKSWGCCASARASASSITRSASLGSGGRAGKQLQKGPVAIFSPD